jgi:hypothetical protein
MSTLPRKIGRVLIRDVAWVAVFLLITRWPRLAGAALTIRGAICVAGLFVALYSIFQVASCVRTYRTSYRETLASLSQTG